MGGFFDPLISSVLCSARQRTAFVEIPTVLIVHRTKQANMATSDKYDRQLRLWGASGQQKLMSTKLLLFNAGPTGSEILKNLVLPGVGSFEICDEHTVCEADLGNNFFVSADDMHEPRCQSVMKWMLEMNPDVRGSFRIDSPEKVIDTDIDYIKNFSLVVATQVVEPYLSKLAAYCQSKSIPLLILHTFGLFGYFRVQVPEHTIINSKPDAPWHDLRIAQPFPELDDFASSFDLATLDSHEHAHVPYVTILIQSIREWKNSHQGQLPSTFAMKEEFKKLVKSKCFGQFGQELNFSEAIDNSFKAYTLPADIIPHEVREVLQRAAGKSLTPTTEPFWFMARSLSDFLSAHKCLPLNGHVPDMTAFTHSYVALQNIYMQKALRDCDEVFANVSTLLESAGCSPTMIARENVAEFCKHSSSIRILETRALTDEFQSVNFSELDMEEENPKQSPLIWYFLIRAVYRFIEEFGKYPGIDDEYEKEAQWLVANARAIVAHGDTNAEKLPAEWITQDHANEICRHCEAELHNISAILGGVGSQEAVKIITRQFMPINHTYVFNGITGCAATYNL
ncbi:Aste57867_22553 [Aphanomyces stellatus]|uniref:NEDD8-activating enzyme E1 regulatory subunit n=1 Tax=Aphanomyces stellatus TaxID=120398 RepID=A0A485LLP4_9STRA|nr:hypothetical protein As57867_022483 [Aphanomyces stellatus]VFT99212.1 Aste57867_22553 [Aphanomyces stellatus]